MEQPHTPWWSTVLRVPTTGGPLWFKAAGDGGVEARLTTVLPDLRLRALVRQARVLAADDQMLRTAPEDALTDAEVAELRARGLAELDRLGGELAGHGIPDSLQHDDLHDGNAFVRDRAYVVFDWGDACVSHPFHTLVVTLRALAYRQGL